MNAIGFHAHFVHSMLPMTISNGCALLHIGLCIIFEISLDKIFKDFIFNWLIFNMITVHSGTPRKDTLNER